MAPKDTPAILGGTDPPMDWDFLEKIHKKTLSKADLSRLVPMLEQLDPEQEDEVDKLRLVLKVTCRTVISEFETRRKLEKREEELKKENKKMNRDIKRYKTQGTGNTALDNALQASLAHMNYNY